MKKNILRLRTICPYCGEKTFSPLRYGMGELAMSVIELKTRDEVLSRNLSLGGPGMAVYFKRCLNCGFMASFDAEIIEKNGKI